MAAEYWDILDKNGNVTGRRIKRNRFNYFRPGQYHLVVHIWITNSRGQYLIQQRSENRMPMPGEWAATGGSARSGEASVTAAIRELHEELGIAVRENEIRYITRLTRKNSFIDMWAVRVDVPAETLTLQKEEVKQAKWVEPEELQRMIRDGEFHNYGPDYFDLVFGG